MNINEILLIKYAKKLNRNHGFQNGTQTITEAKETTDSDKDRKTYLGTSTCTDTQTEQMDTDKDRRITLGTQTCTNTRNEETDSDNYYKTA
ncbi:MAG: hypothetical protein LBH16_09895 [Treponema sp.]|jgi:hypothetical protein|nr:hypothetical protein [Treponema sp.]